VDDRGVFYVSLDKGVVESRIKHVYEAVAELKRLASKRFEEMNVDERYSMRYNVIVLVESMASLCLHLALDYYGLRPESYSDCFREVSSRLGLGCARDLEAMVRLRNLLVHRYWVVRDEIVYESVKKDFRCVEEFVSRVRELASG
jgi:uncharacterized protein YutE (UPF0331/DUF86 family)